MKLPKITAHRLPYDRKTWRPRVVKYWSGKLVYIQLWQFQITLDYRGGPNGIMDDLMGKGPAKGE